MMKKTITGLSFYLLSISSYAEDINIKKGWNLMGAPTAIELNKFDSTCVDYILKYNVDTDTKLGWQHYIANGQYYNYEGTEISSIKEGDGFWVMASSDCSIKINDYIEPPEGSPVITTDTFTIEENTKDIGFLKSSLEDVTYKVVGGDDHIYFNLDEASGMLEFKELMNYEKANNFKQDNNYEIEVSVTSNTDDLLSTTKLIKVDVANQEDSFRFYDTTILNMSDLYRRFEFSSKFEDAVGDVDVQVKYTDSSRAIYPPAGASPYHPKITTENDTTIIKILSPAKTYNAITTYNVEVNATDESGTTIYLTFPMYTTDALATKIVKVYTKELDTINVEYDKSTQIPLEGEVIGSDNIAYSNVGFIYNIIEAPTNGTLEKYRDGTWWYKPNIGYSGSDSFTYQASAGTFVYNSEVKQRVPQDDTVQTVTLNIQAEVQ